MKQSVLQKLVCSLGLFLWLLLVQFVSAIFTLVLILALGIGHLAGPTPLWEWVMVGTLLSVLWLIMGAFTPDVVQPGPIGVVVLLAVWAMAASLMQNSYFLFMPQKACGGMLREIVRSLQSDPLFWTDSYRDLPMGCWMLAAVLGAGLLLRQKRLLPWRKTPEVA